jgi:hypothetical protein
MPTINIRQTMAQEVAEGGSALLSWTLNDELGVPVPLTGLQTLVWTHYNESDGAIVNARNAVNIKNLNGGTVQATSGACTLILTPADNVILDSTKRSEWHVAYIKGTYNAGAGVVEKEVAIRVVNLSKVP